MCANEMIGNGRELSLELSSGCSVTWKDLPGGERVRWSEKCQHFIYNPQTIEGDQLCSLIYFQEGKRPGQLYRRTDGMISTHDCARSHKKANPGSGVVIAAGVLLIGLVVAAFDAHRAAASPALNVVNERTIEKKLSGDIALERNLPGRRTSNNQPAEQPSAAISRDADRYEPPVSSSWQQQGQASVQNATSCQPPEERQPDAASLALAQSVEQQAVAAEMQLARELYNSSPNFQ